MNLGSNEISVKFSISLGWISQWNFMKIPNGDHWLSWYITDYPVIFYAWGQNWLFTLVHILVFVSLWVTKPALLLQITQQIPALDDLCTQSFECYFVSMLLIIICDASHTMVSSMLFKLWCLYYHMFNIYLYLRSNLSMLTLNKKLFISIVVS